MSNLLLLTPQLPYPPHQGTSLRNFHIIEGLARRHQITLLSFLEAQQQSGEPGHTPLSDFCQQVITIPAPRFRTTSRRLRQMVSSPLPDMALRLQSQYFDITLRRLLAETKFDIVQVEGIEMAWAIKTIREVVPKQKIVYDAHNAEAILQNRALQADLGNPRRWLAAAYSWIQTNRLRDFELSVGQQVDWVTSVSQTDKENLVAQLGAETVPITVIPNCIDVAEYNLALKLKPPAPGSTIAAEHDLVFLGKMDYRPNVDAVLWFAEKVWPRILAGKPDATWAIVGQKPHARLNKLQNNPGVTVTGRVEEVQPYLAGAKVFVMPFRVGSGTRLKLIEALAAGMAVVSTSLGVEGYPVYDGKELLLADTASEMAAKVIRLLSDPFERAKLGETGQIFAQQYDWRIVIPIFEDVYDAIGG